MKQIQATRSQEQRGHNDDIAEHLYAMFANPPGQWSEASEDLKGVWCRYADDVRQLAAVQS
jgi:hypothetical protein